MDKTLKTVLIIGGVVAAAGVGYVLYKKYSSTAVKTTPAPAPANPLSSSGIQGYITGASQALTALGNVFGAHVGTNAASPADTGVNSTIHVGTNASPTGTVDSSAYSVPIGPVQDSGQDSGGSGGAEGSDQYSFN